MGQAIVFKYIDFVALLLALAWLVSNPGWEPAVVSVVTFGTFLAADLSIAFRRPSSHIEILEAKQSFPQHLVQSISNVQKFVLDTSLNYEHAALPGTDDPQWDYKQIMQRCVSRGEISFRRIEVIFNRERLEEVLRKLLVYQELEYFIRYYYPPSEPIPVLHIMSFDDEHFYLGGFYPSESPAEELVIYIRHPEMARFFHDYWNILWLKAKPLNEGRRIDWAEVRRIASYFEIDDTEYESMITALKEEVQREKSR